ncbi:hypothetical protein OH809_14320 [Streptomyces sp. NBC_00873]|uniref:hypothetical protein n=1 Tax=unclassified Streptomyces TaxID=2593676 RepID=UPI0038660D4A|nr:hypothetical protein OH809_14320 [Streptomyces sp. NBC_00873]WTA49109.1 hypothetical protein OH821_29360 [Streptomyces sp. NBC_00842]
MHATGNVAWRGNVVREGQGDLPQDCGVTAGPRLKADGMDSSYAIVDPSSPFQNDQPVLRVYVCDKYGGAFLTAHIDGWIIEKNPRAQG